MGSRGGLVDDEVSVRVIWREEEEGLKARSVRQSWMSRREEQEPALRKSGVASGLVHMYLAYIPFPCSRGGASGLRWSILFSFFLRLVESLRSCL